MSSHGFSRRTLVAAGGGVLAAAISGSRTVAARRRAAFQRAPFLTGQVICPDDDAYDEARLDFNARFSRFPAGIVVCSNVEDVQNAIRWAGYHAIPLRVRCGGHSYEAYSVVDDGLVIDVGGLNGVVVDLARGEAVVGAGVRLRDLYRRLWDYGVTLPAGTCPGVGIAGLTLGGGVGFLSRQHGLTCDNLLAVDLVNADGKALRASEREHADLFWALCGGGGGNFGIATAFTFRVHPIGDVVVFSIAWPWDEAALVLDAWQRWAPFVDERLTAGMAVGPPSDGWITCSGQFTGPSSDLPFLLDPILTVGSPGIPAVSTMPFLAAAEYFAGPGGAHSRFKNASAMVYDLLSGKAIDTLVAQLRVAPTAGNLVGCFPLGGAIGTVRPGATAFPHRRALFDLQYQAYWQDDADEVADIAWVRDIREAMLPYTVGAYVNYIDADIPDWQTAYYGSNLPRLMAVKATYDPDNFFNGAQSIPLRF